MRCDFCLCGPCSSLTKFIVLSISHSVPQADNIESSLSTGKWLIFATAAWCGHCKALEPVIAALGKVSAKERFRVGRVDCEDEGSLCSQLGVTSFPHIVLVQAGQQLRFNGNRGVC